MPLAATRDVVWMGGAYRLGERGAERVVQIERVAIERWPVTCARYAEFVRASGRVVTDPLQRRLDADVLAQHPVVEVTFADADAYCAWAGGRLPTSAEWEATARGPQSTTWPWGDAFDETRCNAAESCWGGTTPVDAHPGGASWCGAEDLVGNVWEWVGDLPDEDGWRVLRGGSHLDTSWGLRASRLLAADPHRATATTGFRVAYPALHTSEGRPHDGDA